MAESKILGEKCLFSNHNKVSFLKIVSIDGSFLSVFATILECVYYFPHFHIAREIDFIYEFIVYEDFVRLAASCFIERMEFHALNFTRSRRRPAGAAMYL